MPKNFSTSTASTARTGEDPLVPQPPDGHLQDRPGRNAGPSPRNELKFRAPANEPSSLGPKEGVDPKDLGQAGWGVIFAFQDQEKVPAIKEALGELLQASAGPGQTGSYPLQGIYGPHRLPPGRDQGDFLARHGTGPGPADPDRVPVLPVNRRRSRGHSLPLPVPARRAVRRWAASTSTPSRSTPRTPVAW